MTCNMFVFFFQAEDGIRDTSVTGVQTCALPISPRIRRGAVRHAAWWTSARERRRGGKRGPSPSSSPRSEERRVGKECGLGWSKGLVKEKMDVKRVSAVLEDIRLVVGSADSEVRR